VSRVIDKFAGRAKEEIPWIIPPSATDAVSDGRSKIPLKNGSTKSVILAGAMLFHARGLSRKKKENVLRYATTYSCNIDNERRKIPVHCSHLA